MTREHAARVVGGQHDAGGLDRDVGAGADRDADVGAGQRRGVVDAVADHRDPLARAPAARRPSASLSSGSTSAKTSSMPSSAATASATCCASPVIIATCDAARVQRVDRLARLGADLVLERERADAPRPSRTT